MDFRQIEETQKLNKIKRENECLVCEVVVTKEFKHTPISIIQGHGGPIEMAKTLIDVANSLTREFPEIKDIIPMLNQNSGMRTAYKSVEKMEDL